MDKLYSMLFNGIIFHVHFSPVAFEYLFPAIYFTGSIQAGETFFRDVNVSAIEILAIGAPARDVHPLRALGGVL